MTEEEPLICVLGERKEVQREKIILQRDQLSLVAVAALLFVFGTL